jgi:hypothetical protein
LRTASTSAQESRIHELSCACRQACIVDLSREISLCLVNARGMGPQLPGRRSRISAIHGPRSCPQPRTIRWCGTRTGGPGRVQFGKWGRPGRFSPGPLHRFHGSAVTHELGGGLGASCRKGPPKPRQPRTAGPMAGVIYCALSCSPPRHESTALLGTRPRPQCA